MRLESFERELQLDELIAAVRSPISAAAEDQQQPVRSRQIAQCPNPTVLIREAEIGHLLANSGSGPITVVLCLDKVQPVLGRALFSGTGTGTGTRRAPKTGLARLRHSAAEQLPSYRVGLRRPTCGPAIAGNASARPILLKALGETLPVYDNEIRAIGKLRINWSPP